MSEITHCEWSRDIIVPAQGIMDGTVEWRHIVPIEQIHDAGKLVYFDCSVIDYIDDEGGKVLINLGFGNTCPEEHMHMRIVTLEDDETREAFLAYLLAAMARINPLYTVASLFVISLIEGERKRRETT